MLYYPLGREGEVLPYEPDYLLVRELPGAEGLDVHRYRLGDAYGIGELYLTFVGDACRHYVLGYVPRHVGRAPVDLSGVLTGEAPTAVPRHTPISVDYYLPPRKSRVSLRPPYHEPARRVHMKYRLVVQKLLGYGLPYNVLYYVPLEPPVAHIRIVLGGHHYSVHPYGPVLLVLHRHLGLSVRPEIRQYPLLAHLREPSYELMRQHDRHRHEFRRPTTCEPEHHPLVTGPLFHVEPLALKDPLGYVGGLFVDAGEHGAGVVVEAVLGVGVSYVPYSVPYDRRYVHIAVRGDLTRHEDHPRGEQGLHRHPAVGVLS